jgi:hypothetical protein
MLTYPHCHAENGSLLSFEFEVICLPHRQLVRFLKAGREMAEVRVLGTWSGGGEERVGFRFRDHAFIVIEPFSDNSRYIVLPENPTCPDHVIRGLEQVFRQYRVGKLRQFLADMALLRPLAAFAGLLRHSGK